MIQTNAEYTLSNDGQNSHTEHLFDTEYSCVGKNRICLRIEKKRNTSKYLALIDTDRILCCENALRFDGWTKSHSFTCASALKSIPNYLTCMRRWEYEHKPGSRTSDTKTHMRTRFDITLTQSGVPGREFTLKVRRPEPLI